MQVIIAYLFNNFFNFIKQEKVYKVLIPVVIAILLVLGLSLVITRCDNKKIEKEYKVLSLEYLKEKSKPRYNVLGDCTVIVNNYSQDLYPKDFKRIVKENEYIMDLLKQSNTRVKHLEELISSQMTAKVVREDTAKQDTSVNQKIYTTTYNEPFIKGYTKTIIDSSGARIILQIEIPATITGWVSSKRIKQFPKNWKRPLFRYGKKVDSSHIHSNNPYIKFKDINILRIK